MKFNLLSLVTNHQKTTLNRKCSRSDAMVIKVQIKECAL
jgi:hypothetical protein